MLHALKEYAERTGLSVEPGFKPKAISWALVFQPNGKFVSVQDLRTGEGKTLEPREFERCPDLSQGEIVSAGDGCRPFLVDGLDVIVLLGRDKITDEKKGAAIDAKHAYWTNQLANAAKVVPDFKAIAKTLTSDERLAEIQSQLAEKKAKPTELATIAISRGPGESPEIVVESNVWHDWWRAFRATLAQARETPAKPVKKAAPKKAVKKKGAKEVPVPEAPTVERDRSRMLCMLSGEWQTPQPTHPKVSGLASVGGHSAGDAMSSFDKDAFCSYGLEQGANAAISPQMAATYTAALNKLLRDDRHCVTLAGAKVVYWFDREIPRELDPVPKLMGFEDDDEENEEQPAEPTPKTTSKRAEGQAEGSVHKSLRSVKTGEQGRVTKDATFFALTLSGNSGRVVVRDAMEGRFEDLEQAIAEWFEDLKIVDRYGNGIVERFKFNSILAAPYRDLRDAVASTAAGLWRAAIKGGPLPAQVMAQTLRRVTIDIIQGESPRHARYGVLKACLNRVFRNQGIIGMNREVSAEADELQKHPAYICGRVMGVLAAIQKRALKDVKAGVVERFFAAAMATPGLVLGRLVRTAEVAHIPLIRKDPTCPPWLASYFQNLLADAWQKIEQRPPTTLTLEEQTLFAMGYYHQRAARKAKLTDGTTVDVDGEDEST